MSVHVYRWDDADAPVLTSNGPGAMANLLRKCLVDGYGTGAEEKLPAGWSVDWDSTSNAKAAFLPGAPEAQTCHYYVDDTGTVGAGGNKVARIWMIENWAGFDASDNPTGTLIPSDVTWGRTIAKNNDDADATAVPWVLVATDYGFYFVVSFHSTDTNMDGGEPPAMIYVGRAIGYGPADDYIDTLMCSGYENYVYRYSPAYDGPMLTPRYWSLGDAPHNAVARRDHTGSTTGGALGTRCGAGGPEEGRSNCGFNPSIPYPDPVTGGLLTARILLTTGDPELTDVLIRGHLPGIVWPLHAAPLTPFSEIVINGRTYLALRAAVNSGSNGQALIDTTGPWE